MKLTVGDIFSGVWEMVIVAWRIMHKWVFYSIVVIAGWASLLLTACTSQPTKTTPGVIVEPVTVNRVQYVPIPEALTDHGEVYVRKDDTIGEYVVSSERNTAALTACYKQLDDIASVQGSQKE